MSANKLLDLLEESGLLEAATLRALRKQVAEQRVTAAAIAKHLVDKGHLTRFQATNFVSAATGESPASGDAGTPGQNKDDLQLADEDELIQGLADPEGEEVVLLEDAGDSLQPVEDADGGLTPVGQPVGLTPLGKETGGIDDLFSDDDDFDVLGAPLESPPQSLGRVRRRRNVWDSKLMFGGGLALALLAILFVVLFVNLWKAPAVEMWDAAMELYRNESYSQAQALFEEFLEDYPEDENASEARVRVVLCKIRNVLREPQEALERADNLLPAIESEPAFTVARDELATMLVQIPRAFVDAAKSADARPQKEALVELAEAGLELVNNPSYVPSSRRDAIQRELRRIMEDVNLVHRDINRDRELAEAIQAIDSFAALGETPAAYSTYQELLRTYPGLANSPELIEAIRGVTSRQQDLVESLSEAISATTDAVPADEPRWVLVERTGGTADQPTLPLAFVISDAAYGVDPGSGEVAWRRPLGNGFETASVRTGPEDDSDLLLVDSSPPALLRVAAGSGSTVWRLPLGGRLFAPSVTSRAAYVTQAEGVLVEVDLATGDSSRQLRFPQPLSGSAAAAPSRPLLFQLGSHSNLYVLSTDPLACVSVAYLGHQEGAVAVPPVAHLGHVFVAENVSDDEALLHVFSIESDGDQIDLESAQTPLRLTGNVIVPMQLYGRRLLVVTDRGAVEVLDIDLNKRPPASRAASLAPTLDRPLPLFPVTDAGSLWLAGDRLTEYRVQVTTREITRRGITNLGDTFLASPRIWRGSLLHARKPKDAAGVLLASSPLNDLRAEEWTCRLDVPVSELAAGPSGGVRAITVAGQIYELPDDDSGPSVQEPTDNVPGNTRRWSTTVPLPAGETLIWDPQRPAEAAVLQAEWGSRVRMVRFELDDGEVTAAPIVFQDGLLFPLRRGEVRWLSIRDGAPLGKPFRPPRTPGEEISWTRGIVLEESYFAIANDRREVMRIGLESEPAPYLKQDVVTATSAQLVSDLAFWDNNLYAIGRSPTGDTLLVMDATDLSLVKRHSLAEARATWGPHRVGDGILLSTDYRQLHRYASEEGVVWQADLGGQPVTVPLIDGDAFLLATRGGEVLRVARDSGEILTRSRVEGPLRAGPLRLTNGVVVGGENGVLHLLDLARP